MAEQDPQQLVVATRGDIYIAEVGSTIPADPDAAPAAEWTKLGYTTEDGVTFNRSIDVEEFMAWQSRTAVRREVTGEEITASFELEQWNEDNFAFAFGGGDVVEESPNLFSYEFPTGADALDERSLLVRWSNGDKHYQLAFGRGSVTDEVEFDLTRSDLAVLPIAFKALAEDDSSGVSFLTDDLAFGAAS